MPRKPGKTKKSTIKKDDDESTFPTVSNLGRLLSFNGTSSIPMACSSPSEKTETDDEFYRNLLRLSKWAADIFLENVGFESTTSVFFSGLVRQMAEIDLNSSTLQKKHSSGKRKTKKMPSR